MALPQSPVPLWTAEELVEATGGRWVHEPPPSWLPTGITHRRKLSDVRPGDIYVTMDARTRRRAEGKREDTAGARDTADELPDLMAAGISAVIAQRDIASPPASLPLLRVHDSHRAVLDLARAARERFAGRAIAITGTVGKSTTKEMLRHVLARQAPTFATKANMNTFFGVPLSLAQTPRDSRYGVYELSIASLYKRSGPVSLLVRPHVAIFTAIGRGLERHVDSIEAIADFKSRIFRGLEPGGVAIINRDMPLFERVQGWARQYGASQIVTFGEHPEAQVRLANADLRPEHSLVAASVHGEAVEFEIPLPGRAMILNGLATLAAVHALAADWRLAAADLASYETREGRLRRFPVPLPGGAFELIDDSFNAEQASMIASFEVLSLARPSPGGRRIAVLGRIGNLTNPDETHAELVEPLLSCGVDRVFTLGDELIHLRRRLPEHLLGAHAESARQLADAVLAEVRPGDVVSAKGCSITARFDRVVRYLRVGQPATAAVARGPATRRSPPADVAIRSRHKIDICFLGDTYLGEHYQRRRAERGEVDYLQAHGYRYSLSLLRPFLLRADLVVANLEATLTERRRSPLDGKKDWILRGSPKATIRALQDSNIRVVGLGNNHAADYGEAGLADTIAALAAQGMRWFGAGGSLAEADRPLDIGLELRGEPLGLRLFSAYQYLRSHDQTLEIYAGSSRAGVACLSTDLLEAIAAIKQRDPRQLVVVFPHWGKNYSWRSDEQAEIADWLLAAGADLIIGHGAHMMQEVERRAGRWVVYGLGNFIFNSEGEHARRGVPPYSLIARLRLAANPDEIDKALYLYPILSDNKLTRFRPRFVDATEFADAVRQLSRRNADLDPGNALVTTGRDEHGWHLRLPLGS